MSCLRTYVSILYCCNCWYNYECTCIFVIASWGTLIGIKYIVLYCIVLYCIVSINFQLYVKYTVYNCFSFDYCIVCLSIYDFWLPFCYLQHVWPMVISARSLLCMGVYVPCGHDDLHPRPFIGLWWHKPNIIFRVFQPRYLRQLLRSQEGFHSGQLLYKSRFLSLRHPTQISLVVKILLKVTINTNKPKQLEHALKSDSTHHFFRNACTKSGSLRFSQFSGCWLILSVYIIMSFDFPFVRLFGVR